jgi:hypothetical protein
MSGSSTTAAAPELVTITAKSTALCAVSAITWMIDAGEDIERLWHMYAAPSALRRRRLDQRDEAIREVAAGYTDGSGRALAHAISRDLQRHAASVYRHSAPPADAKRALLHRVLDLVGAGKVPSAAQIRGILAGVRS